MFSAAAIECRAIAFISAGSHLELRLWCASPGSTSLLAIPRRLKATAVNIAVKTAGYVQTRMAVTRQLEQGDGAGATGSQITLLRPRATLAGARRVGQPAHATRGPMIWED